MPKKQPHDEGKKAAPKSSPKKKRSRKKSAPLEGRDEKGHFTSANPTAWKPGQSGNPAGRPKTRTLSEAYRDKLKEPCEFDESRTWAEYIADRQVRAAAGHAWGENSTMAARELADRTEGKPTQAVQLDVKGEAKRMLAMMLGCDEQELPEANP